MRNKFKALVAVSVILTFVFTMAFSFAASAEMQGHQNGKFNMTPTKDRLQQRDRDCQQCCECINDCDMLRLRLHICDNEAIEQLVLFNNLRQRLEQANMNRNKDEVEELKPQLERVRARISEMLMQRQQTAEQLKLQLKEMVKNEFANREINRLRHRIGTIEAEILVITNILNE